MSMASVPADALTYGRSSTGTSGKVQGGVLPRSVTPQGLSAERPRRSSTPWLQVNASPALCRSLTPQSTRTDPQQPQWSTLMNSRRSSTPQKSLIVDQAISLQRPVTPQRPMNPHRGNASGRGISTPTSAVLGEGSGTAAKQSSLVTGTRWDRVDPPQRRSSMSQPPCAGHLFEDTKPSSGVHNAVTALQAHGSAWASFFSSPQVTHSQSRPTSPTNARHAPSSASVTSAAETEGVDISVGAGNVPRFTEDKARILRQKMREMENYHDTMYHSGLASRMA